MTHWWTGNVACMNCLYQWVGVVEIYKVNEYPVISLECPECHEMEGKIL